MQTLAPVSPDRNPNQHTTDEVRAALRGVTGSRRFSFRYELLDKSNVFVDELDNVLAAKVEMNWLADIKRVARFTLRETGGVDFLSDRIKPHVRIWLPPYGKLDFVEYPQGVFLLSSPRRNIDEQGRVTRDVEAFDALQVYSDDLMSTRYAVPRLGIVTDYVKTLLGNVPQVVAPSNRVLGTAMEWEPGTSKLRIINDLLSVINYESLSFDEDGRALVRPYVAPTSRAEEYEYATDTHGLIVPNVDQELDLFSIPNKWTLVVSEPEMPALVASYTNADPGSPTSTIRRGRTITDFRTEQDAVDLTTLQEKAARLAFEASQIYEAIDFSTAMMPIHSGNDVYRLRYDPLAINARYSEQSWSFDLKAGATMKHRARRVVSV